MIDELFTNFTRMLHTINTNSDDLIRDIKIILYMSDIIGILFMVYILLQIMIICGII